MACVSQKGRPFGPPGIDFQTQIGGVISSVRPDSLHGVVLFFRLAWGWFCFICQSRNNATLCAPRKRSFPVW